jgi:Concanavalin A-like lectin/glucanases superfamily
MNAAGIFDTLRARFGARLARRAAGVMAVVVVGAVVAGCGAGSVSPTANPAASSGTVTAQSYTGPAPASAEVQAFAVNVWNNVKGTDRCGSCHIQGNQSPMFARSDDVNLAYQAAQAVAVLSNPATSKLVTQVANGHHCWLASNQACADTMTTWIQNWAGVALGGAAKATVQLVAPPSMAPGSTKSFPATSTLFASTVYPLLTQYCSRCHSPNAVTAQSPYFAQPDVDAAYAAAQPKMDLNTPTNSRFYQRLAFDFHNCWGGDCAAASAQMLAAIQAFANQVQPTQVNQSWVMSKALTMYDGVVDSGTRVETGLVAKYEFKTGTGTTAYDTSGVTPGNDLEMQGNVTWVGGWGVQVEAAGKLQGTTNGSVKLHDMILQSGEYSVEAWVAPDNVTQMNAYIVSYSGGTTQRNFTLGQTQYSYDSYVRTTTTSANGMPPVSTPQAGQVLQATLQHVVLTYDPVNGRQIFVNGALVASGDPQKGGSLSEWDNTFALVLGNEVSSDRPWSGLIKFVAVYNRAMPLADIQTNFNAGIGERYYLLFNVDQYTGLNQSYVMFVVSQFDSYSYLFNQPQFLSLDPTVTFNSVPIQGMRIAINGAEATVGQAYAPLSTTVSGAGFDPTKSAISSVPLSAVGTTIPLENGPAYDQFFLTFEKMGSFTFTHTDPAPIAPTPVDSALPADIGVRTFEQVNTTLAVMTSVPKSNPTAFALYQNLQQALPATPAFQGFVSSHETAIAQLSIQYCDLLANDPVLRAAYFPGFDFTQPPATAFGATGFSAMTTPLINNMLTANVATGQFLATQPTAASVTTELQALVTKLTPSVTADSNGTVTIVAASCAAVAGSAAMLVN